MPKMRGWVKIQELTFYQQLKSVYNICVQHCRRFDKQQFVFVRELLGFFSLNFTEIFVHLATVDLVSDQDDHAILLGHLLETGEPVIHAIIESTPLVHVIDQKSAVSSLVLLFDHTPIPLLPRCIPYLSPDSSCAILQRDELGCEFDSNRRWLRLGQLAGFIPFE